MKKLLAALFTVLLFLTACGNQTDNDTSDEESSEQAQSAQEEDDENDADDRSETQSDGEANEESGDETEDKADDSDNADNEDSDNGLTDFAEYDVLADEIDVDTLQADVKTDNPNKRVILYADDNGEKKYKSIYIKKKDRLKIIHLGEDGQIFNDVID